MKTIIRALCFLFVLRGSTVSPQFQDFEIRNGFTDYPPPFSHNHSHYGSSSKDMRYRHPEDNYDQFRHTPSYDEYRNLRNYYDYNGDRETTNRDNPRNYYDYNGDRETTNTKSLSNGYYRTYGRGQAVVSRRGETVTVPNGLGNRQASRVMDRDVNENRGNGRGRCKECPGDQTVVATKLKDFVILPEPCPSNPRLWYQHSGPTPGSKIREGVHLIRGNIGSKKKYCEYQYQVLVRRCEPLQFPEDTTIDCTANDLWGSECTVTCNYDKEPIGPTVLECTEDLKWSNSIPKCKAKTDCSMPKIRTKTKIWCQTTNMTQVEGDFIPNGSYCRFNKNGKTISLNCKEGTWRIPRKIRKNKPKYKTTTPVYETPTTTEKIVKNNPCDPNPCHNGGTCLRPNNNKGPPICRCRPQTQGANCEHRECDYNPCYNYGQCFFINNERTCYCLPEFSGEICQNQMIR